MWVQDELGRYVYEPSDQEKALKAAQRRARFAGLFIGLAVVALLFAIFVLISWALGAPMPW